MGSWYYPNVLRRMRKHTINQTDAVDNHLSGADADGNTVTNDFKTSAVNGTTQAAEKTSADGKESTKTVNNTSAGGPLLLGRRGG